MNRNSIILILIMFFAIMSSCSHGSNPVITEDTGELQGPYGNANSPEISRDVAYSPYNILGAWMVYLDPVTMDFELIPSRNARAIGDVFDSDLSQFLLVSPCSNCLQITKFYMSRFYIGQIYNLDVVMKHPFNDISKRPDLHGFDVRAIFLFDDPTQAFDDIEVIKPDNTTEPATIAGNIRLFNYDGYISHFDNLVTDERYFRDGVDVPGNLNPFVRFFESYSAGAFDPNSPSGHNVMPVGSNVYKRTIKFALSQTQPIRFYIIADVAYGQSAVLANRKNPQYYLPAFHRTEPWRMEYWIENNTLSPNNPNSNADIMVQVFDWQQGAPVDPDYPNPSNLGGIPESSNVKELVLSCPMLQNDPEIVTSPESGSGAITDPLIYRMTVRNENLCSDWLALGLLAVRDELNGKAAPSGRLPIPSSPKGFPYETEDILDYSFYYVVIINLPNSVSDTQYHGELMVDPSTQYDYGSGTSIWALFFMDFGGSKFQYRWDYDYDGITFDVDGGGMPSPTITFNSPGLHYVGLRVRTNSVPPREYIYSIPVYKKGEAFDYTLNSPSARDITSSRSSHSIALFRNKIFVAYVSNRNNKRNIYVAYIEDDGTTRIGTASNYLAPSKEYYEPSIAVRHSLFNNDVYIAYTCMDTSTNERDIYLTRADDELVVFAIGIEVAVQSGITERTPCLVSTDNALYAYYSTASMMGNHIIAAKSTDRGSTWTNQTEVDDSSVSQNNPSTVYDGDSEQFYCLYQDGRDYSLRGYDIYMATSAPGDGTSFTSHRNLSMIQGKIHEVEPSASFYNDMIYCAYLAYEDGTTDKCVHVKVVDPLGYSHDDFRFILTINSTHLSPTIVPYKNGGMAVAYGDYSESTSQLRLRITDVEAYGAGDYVKSTICNKDLGTVDPDEAVCCPALVFQSTIYEGIKKLYCFYNHFNDGIENDPTPFPMVFGKVALDCNYMSTE